MFGYGLGFAQGPERPPLFLSEGWQVQTTPPDDHGAWPASQSAVASPKLELSLHGTSADEIVLVAVRGSADAYPLNLWTGTTTSPSAATLRDRDRFVDLSGCSRRSAGSCARRAFAKFDP